MRIMMAVAVLMAACSSSDEPASPADLHAVGMCEAEPSLQCEAPCSGSIGADISASFETNPTLAECMVNNPQRNEIAACVWLEWDGHRGCCYWSDAARVNVFAACLDR